jgi:hypothetical protein
LKVRHPSQTCMATCHRESSAPTAELAVLNGDPSRGPRNCLGQRMFVKYRHRRRPRSEALGTSWHTTGMWRRAGRRTPGGAASPSRYRAAEYLIAVVCILASRGELNVSTSMVDDEGIDLIFHRRESPATLAVQVKARMSDSKLVGQGTGLRRSRISVA